MISHTSVSRRGGGPVCRSAAALAWVALLLLAVFSAGIRPAFAQASKTIDVNAKIHITLADEPDITGDYVVDPNGDVSMLYVNQVHLAGLTVAQAAAKLESKQYLGQYYKHPQVVVTITNPGGITVTVSGDVANQKDVTIRSDARLNEVVLAASPQVDADLSKVQITRGPPDAANKQKLTVDFLAFRNNNDPVGNPQLQDGDVIYVPSKVQAPLQVTFSGDFTKLGQSAIPAGTTVYNAIQQNGGPTATVNLKSYAIQHTGSTDRVPFDYEAARENPSDPKVNPVLQDGDTLVANSQATAVNSYTITGAVHTPGPFPLTTPYVLLSEALGRAGGPISNARLNEVSIVRPTANGSTQTIHVDAKDPAVQGSTKLYPGDNVNIPQGSGAGRYDPLTVLGALGSVGTLFYLFKR